MINLFAGYKTQIRVLERKLKELDHTKLNPSKVKELTEAIKNLKDLVQEKEQKRDERRKAKEQKAQEVAKEATPKVEDGNVVMPKKEFVDEHEKLVKELEPMVEEHKEQGAELEEVKKEAAPKCAICGVEFKSYPEYQQHQVDAHGAQKEYSPMDPAVKKQVVKDVEHKLGPAIISEQEKSAPLNKKIHFKLDQIVKPVRGSESKGRVMRHDSPEDLVYIFWDDGVLKDRDVAGGYYPNEIVAVEEPKPVEAAVEEPKPIEDPKCPCYEDMSVYCPKCKSRKTSDLKTNYEDMLKDLKSEHKEALDKHDHIWIARLEQKIKELEEKIQERFGNEKTSNFEGKCDLCKGPVCERCKQCHNCVKITGSMGKECGAQNAEHLTVMDHTPPRANKTMEEGGSDGQDEFQDEWAEPKIASINVFNKKWNSKATKKAGKLSYEISDENNKKMLSISPLNGKEMGAEHLKWACEREITKNYKKATLKENISFMKKGSKVWVISDDGKKAKIANLEAGVRAYVQSSKIQLEALESQAVSHNGHQDRVLGSTSTETLLDCIEGGPIWVNSTELLDANRPPATPESLNPIEEEAAKKEEKCPGCGKKAPLSYRREWQSKGCEECHKLTEDRNKWLKEPEDGRPYPKQAAKDCPDCHGNFAGKEDEKCPTCGRFSVQKEGLRTQLPPLLPDERAHVNAAKHCAICGTEYNTFPEYQQHQKEKHSHPKPVKCSDCGKAFETVQEVEQHKGTEHKVASTEKKAGYGTDYSGYTNRSTWGLSLWLDNDQALYDASRKLAAGARDADELAAMLRHRYSNLLESKQEEGMNSKEVNWKEIALDLLNENKENVEYEQSVSPETVINKLPVMNVEQEKDKLIDQLAIETDPEKKKSLERRYKHLTMASLNKVAHIRHENGKWVVYSHDYSKKLGTYPTKEKALKRLRQIEYYKNASRIRPFSKKAEVLINPYQELQTHVENMKQRMSEVSERLQNSPLPKVAESDILKGDQTPAQILEDIEMAVALVETKLGGDDIDPELHNSIESLENELFSLETKLGVTKELPADEAKEPEHEKVKEEREEVSKESAIPNNPAMGTPVTPVVQNVQPTDDDNLENPTQMPTSPLPAGQHWQWNAVTKKYEAMTDPANINKVI